VVFTAVLVAVGFAPRDAVALELPPGFSTVEIATGLDGPTALAYAPDGRMFVTEKAGRVRVVDATGRLQAEPVIDISNHVNSYWDRGLLGIAVDAQFVTNHYVYLLYVNETNAIDPTASKTSRLTRIEVTSDNRVAKPDAPETVLLGGASEVPCPPPGEFVDCIPADGFSHSIGTVRADPDGTLWLGSGDASGFWGVDPKAVRTYDENSFAGKLIHIDRDGRGLRGHPFCSTQTNLNKVCTKLYAKGFRNPFRFQLRPGRGPFVGDVGWNTAEELDVTQPGRSYGWPCYEGRARTPSYPGPCELRRSVRRRGAPAAGVRVRAQPIRRGDHGGPPL
jgi:glucose/arabinose dehydrogenase